MVPFPHADPVRGLRGPQHRQGEGPAAASPLTHPAGGMQNVMKPMWPRLTLQTDTLCLPLQAQQAHNNNYSRPAGQNVGNFLTERNSSKVTHAPGGNSQVGPEGNCLRQMGEQMTFLYLLCHIFPQIIFG